MWHEHTRVGGGAAKQGRRWRRSARRIGGAPGRERQRLVHRPKAKAATRQFHVRPVPRVIDRTDQSELPTVVAGDESAKPHPVGTRRGMAGVAVVDEDVHGAPVRVHRRRSVGSPAAHLEQQRLACRCAIRFVNGEAKASPARGVEQLDEARARVRIEIRERRVDTSSRLWKIVRRHPADTRFEVVPGLT